MSIIYNIVRFLNKRNIKPTDDYSVSDDLADFNSLKTLNISNDNVDLFFNPKYNFIEKEQGKVKIKVKNPNKDTSYFIFMVLEILISPILFLFDNSHIFYFPEIMIVLLELLGTIFCLGKIHLVIDYVNHIIYKEYSLYSFKSKEYKIKFSEIDKVSLNYYVRSREEISFIGAIDLGEKINNQPKNIETIESEIVLVLTYGDMYNFSIDSNDMFSTLNEKFGQIIALVLKKCFVENPNHDSIKINSNSNNNKIYFIAPKEKEPEIKAEFGAVFIIFGAIIIIYLCYIAWKNQI